MGQKETGRLAGRGPVRKGVRRGAGSFRLVRWRTAWARTPRHLPEAGGIHSTDRWRAARYGSSFGRRSSGIRTQKSPPERGGPDGTNDGSRSIYALHTHARASTRLSRGRGAAATAGGGGADVHVRLIRSRVLALGTAPGRTRRLGTPETSVNPAPRPVTAKQAPSSTAAYVENTPPPTPMCRFEAGAAPKHLSHQTLAAEKSTIACSSRVMRRRLAATSARAPRSLTGSHPPAPRRTPRTPRSRDEGR